jgi:hypothetical protein
MKCPHEDRGGFLVEPWAYAGGGVTRSPRICLWL